MAKSFFLFCFISFFLAGCQSSNKISKKHSKKEDLYSLSSAPFLCSTKGQEPPFTPPKLYEAMKVCVKQKNYKKAAFAYLLAGTYSFYDTTRVKTHYSRMLHPRLANTALSSLTKQERNQLWDELNRTMRKSQGKKDVCHLVMQEGIPEYRPAYMLKNTISYKNNTRGDFNAALKNYLHCDLSPSLNTKVE